MTGHQTVNVLGPGDYRCEQCGGVFTDGRSVDQIANEAIGEARENFPTVEAEDFGVVCDDCYRVLMPVAVLEGAGFDLEDLAVTLQRALSSVGFDASDSA